MNFMYICLCHKVTHLKMKQTVISKKIYSFSQLCNELQIAMSCGKCLVYAKNVMDNILTDIDNLK